ncbi:MAG: ABC transporter substrate-binding protein [Anaerolineae bacterium]|nr:ABC transporter substrate-binding protein [Anaerolineae bacterium]
MPFAVVSGEQVVLARSKQVPVKYVMQWYRKYPIAVIASAKANIKTPADLKGKNHRPARLSSAQPMWVGARS